MKLPIAMILLFPSSKCVISTTIPSGGCCWFDRFQDFSDLYFVYFRPPFVIPFSFSLVTACVNYVNLAHNCHVSRKTSEPWRITQLQAVQSSSLSSSSSRIFLFFFARTTTSPSSLISPLSQSLSTLTAILFLFALSRPFCSSLA